MFSDTQLWWGVTTIAGLEIKAELLRITDDLSEIKEQSLGKQDFYRSIGEINESIKQLRDILMKQNGEP